MPHHTPDGRLPKLLDAAAAAFDELGFDHTTRQSI